MRERERRIWPARDEKILTAWNALTIKGLAIAARCFERPDFERAADSALDFIRGNLWRDGRLFASWKDGQARHPAYLDDHAFLADAILELLQTRWRSEDLTFLVELIEVMLARFEDPQAHGFFFTADDHEKLIHRMKSFADDAIPAGNGVAAAVLCRAGHLLGELAREPDQRAAGFSAVDPDRHRARPAARDRRLGTPSWENLLPAADVLRHSGRCRGSAPGACRQAPVPNDNRIRLRGDDLLRSDH